MTVLLIDNDDSFTWNLVELARQCGVCDVVVRPNDSITPAEALTFDGVLLSPGPGVARDAGRLCEVIRVCAPCTRILGVCLGHQAIAEVFGAAVERLDTVFHGVTTAVRVVDEEELLFRTIASPFTAGLYHSWAVARERFPADLVLTAVSDEGLVMGLRHRHFDVRGVQFHPESFMTPSGMTLFRNWLEGFPSKR